MNFQDLKEVADGILASNGLSERVSSINVGHNFLSNQSIYTASVGSTTASGASIIDAATLLASLVLTPENAALHG